MSIIPLQANFYITGGTIPLGASSYVVRRADEELYLGLEEGRFCYVLTSRQMGKSSLINRVANRLRDAGAVVAELDLTGIGQNLTADQWYDGLVYELGRELGLKSQLNACWREHGELGPLHRFLAVLRNGVLANTTEPVVICVDEIEVVRSLAFSTDEFFAAIRECYNRRASDPVMQRLTFCLLGMATPADLIRDPRITPFNIGTRIDLTDFTREEAAPLAAGLNKDHAAGMRMLDRVLYWTSGHPYLTQRLCMEAASETGSGVVDIDRVCDRLFLCPRAREADPNLAPVRHYLLHSEKDRVGLLELHGKVRSGKRVAADEADHLVGMLRLAGVAGVVNGGLRVRNRIYAEVFDRAWVRENMPDAELRRQRAAYRRGLLRATLVSSAIVMAMAGLAWEAVKEARLANQHERDARRLLYIADINLAQQALEQHNITRALSLLEAHKDESQRGFEFGYLWRLSHSDLHTFEGHTSIVYGVAFSPDGALLATASDDGTVKLWDVASKQLVRTLDTHIDTCHAVAFSPNGKWLAAGAENSVLVWNTATWSAECPPQKQKQFVMSVAFSPNSRWLGASNEDHTATLWDTGQWKPVHILKGHLGRVNTIQFSPDNRWAVTASDDKTVRLWDIATGKVLRVYSGHAEAVTCAAFSPDGRMLASGGVDHTLIIWDTASGEKIRTINNGDQIVSAVAFSPDGGGLATGDNGSPMRLWDVKTGALVTTYEGHAGTVNAIAFSPNGMFLASAGWDHTAKLWDARRDENGVFRPRFPADLYRSSALSGDGNLFAGEMFGSAIDLWDITRMRKLRRLSCTLPAWFALAFSANRNELYAASDHDTITVYDASTGQAKRRIKPPIDVLYCLACSPKPGWLAAGSAKGVISVWQEGGEAQPLKIAVENSRGVNTVAFSRNGNELAAAGGLSAMVWSLTNRRRLITITGHRVLITAIAFSEDGRCLATGDMGGTLKLWNIETGRDLLTLTSHDGELQTIAFSENGSAIRTVSSTGAIRVWRTSGPDRSR